MTKRLITTLSIVPFLPGHTLVPVKLRPGQYDLECIDKNCDFKTGIIISETTHSSYRGNSDLSTVNNEQGD